MRHYRVVLYEASEPVGLTSAAIRKCMCCGLILCSMGGGGDYLCDNCLSKIRIGKIAEALDLLVKEDRELVEK